MTEKLDSIEKALTAGQKVSQEDQDLIATLLADEEGQKGEAKKAVLEKGRQAFEDLDFDSMPQKSVVAAVMKRIGQEFDNRFKELKGHFDSALSQSALDNASANLATEIKEMSGKYGEEFKTAYKDTLKVAEKNPNLTLEECFTLATSSNVRDSLNKINKEKKLAADKAAGITLPDSVTDAALTEGLGDKKTHASVAQEIADRLGIE